MALILSDTDHLLNAKLTGAANSVQPTFIASYALFDTNGNYSDSEMRAGDFDDGNEVAIVEAPNGTSVGKKIIKTLYIYNADDANVVVHLYFSDGADDTYICKTTLVIGFSLIMDERGYLTTIDTSGELKMNTG